MAKFEEWIQPGKRRYRRIYDQPTYQELYNDPGNWTGGSVGSGVLVGTNRSISAPVLSAWRGYTVTKEQMKSLSADEALNIYKVKYWDKVKGDSIKSQVMAEFAADMKSSIGNSKPLQRALSDVGYIVQIDGSVGEQTLAAINAVHNAGKTYILYNSFRDRMIEHYQSVPNFAATLINQLNKDYPKRDKNDPIFAGNRTGMSTILISLFLSVVLIKKIVK